MTKFPDASSMVSGPSRAAISDAMTRASLDFVLNKVFKLSLLMSVSYSQHRACLLQERVGIEGLRHVEIRTHFLAALAVEFLAFGG